ncbi:hypothetical protein PQO01_04225 [Lentisphaera marina]|nr:hypothetical protein [Lentisphaera marina]MDD7984159.1 hypothetical protein [Lentisphaera marina]
MTSFIIALIAIAILSKIPKAPEAQVRPIPVPVKSPRKRRK